jgi:tetratricopeptide (TPR) repeat protein
MSKVNAIRESLSIPTYGVGVPEKNPAFFEKRVYQGSSGKVYPVPFIDKVCDEPQDQSYDSVRLENDYVRLVMLPEIGGRIFLGQDKSNEDYDFFYRQDVIKPALVGLAGPWISGGVEFNWPQHHRPGTFMPADVHLETDADGVQTVWMSEHDPINRLKGLHGIRLRPDSALVELRARLFNRTPFTQTFLWWANVAAMVHDNYQSFFPPDVHYVADHAVRATSSFPNAENPYYGIDYQNRTGENDLSWYKNIPVPTSYMVCDTDFAFFGGYDFDAEGGFIHVANKHVSPGKKQWTWGNDEFGWAWDRELTDENGPYVELMAGVYTDNQPDFSYLNPYETKTFSQFWWPYKKIGPVQNATEDAAIRLVVNEDRSLDLGVAVSRPIENARVVLCDGEQIVLDIIVTITPDEPWQEKGMTFEGEREQTLKLVVEDAKGAQLVAYRPVETENLKRHRDVATEPPAPEEIATIEELYLTAEHLEQYRHPTRDALLYWDEALRRDPKDARTNIALGRRYLQRGQLEDATVHFETAISRLTRRHPNPVTGEAHYYLGLSLRFQGLEKQAYSAFYKSAWNYEWRAAAYYELAQLDCCRGDYAQALEHLEAALDTNRQNNKAQVLKAVILRKTGQDPSPVLKALLSVDPLDHWARFEQGDTATFLEKSRNDAQTVLDIAYDYADAGFFDDAIKLLELHHANGITPVAVPNPLEKSQLTHYALAWLQDRAGMGEAFQTLEKARAMTPDYLFPSRLHDQIVLEWALAQAGGDANAAYGLGNYFFDRKRHEEAIAVWEQARQIRPDHATLNRNLGIAYWNIRNDGAAARSAYEKAVACDPADARLFYELDQLKKKLNEDPRERLAALEANLELVAERDDCTVELAALYNLTDQPGKAMALLASRRFHPWEGGEGQVLRQYTSARLKLGQAALTQGTAAAAALEHFENAMQVPENLGEAYHLLQAKADVNYWTGKALRALGRETEALARFKTSASEAGDFQAMAVIEHSDLSYYRALSLQELGLDAEAKALCEDLDRFARQELATSAAIDYFATSLPLLLVFEDDLDQRKNATALFLQALAATGCGDDACAKELFEQVLQLDRAHPGASEHLKRLV